MRNDAGRFQATIIAAFSSVIFLVSPATRASDLGDAIQAGDLAHVKSLLAAGADPNGKSLYGGPLNIAAQQGSTEIIAALIDAGANLETLGMRGRHPLHTAAALGETEVAKLLIARGAEVDSLDEGGQTPLIAAAIAAGQIDNTEMVKILLAAGADPRREDSAYHMTPLHFAGAKGSVAVVELLIAAGVNVNLSDGSGSTVLHHAAADARLKVVQFLVDHGADVNIANKAGETPLKLARGNSEMEKVLRQAGARN